MGSLLESTFRAQVKRMEPPWSLGRCPKPDEGVSSNRPSGVGMTRLLTPMSFVCISRLKVLN